MKLGVGRWALGVTNSRQNPAARVVVLRLTWKASEFEAWKVGRLRLIGRRGMSDLADVSDWPPL